MMYDIVPCPKPRMTRRDKWLDPPRSCVARYRAFADEARLKIGQVDLNYSSVLFILPMPRSWKDDKKAAHLGQVHEAKPDLSNLLKALEDVLYQDDKTIHTYLQLRKVWGHKGAIQIQLAPRD